MIVAPRMRTEEIFPVEIVPGKGGRCCVRRKKRASAFRDAEANSERNSHSPPKSSS